MSFRCILFNSVTIHWITIEQQQIPFTAPPTGFSKTYVPNAPHCQKAHHSLWMYRWQIIYSSIFLATNVINLFIHISSNFTFASSAKMFFWKTFSFNSHFQKVIRHVCKTQCLNNVINDISQIWYDLNKFTTASLFYKTHPFKFKSSCQNYSIFYAKEST